MVGAKGQNSTFSENDHVADQIKGNHKCSNMVANTLPDDPPPPTLGFKGSKFNLFSTCMLHIKLKGITHAATRSQISCLQIPSDPGGGVKRSKFDFSEQSHVAYQIKMNHKCTIMVANSLPADPNLPWGWGQNFKIQLFRTWSL